MYLSWPVSRIQMKTIVTKTTAISIKTTMIPKSSLFILVPAGVSISIRMHSATATILGSGIVVSFVPSL